MMHAVPADRSPRPRAEVIVDLDAIRHNVGLLAAAAASSGAATMAVVKADGYGHGAAAVSRAALDAGASWLGVCTLDEALELRAAGITAPVLSWLHVPDEDFGPAVEADVDLSVSSVRHLAAVLDAARRTGRPARLHLKVDTGLSRGGAQPAEWAELVEAAAKARCRRRRRGRRGLVPPGARRRSRARHAGPAGRAARRRVPGRPRRRPRPDPAPGQLSGHDDPARPALRPGPPGYRGVRAGPAGPPAGARPRCGRR